MFGINYDENAIETTAFGLHSLQHRGQDYFGIVTKSGGPKGLRNVKGVVADNFDFANRPHHAGHLSAIGNIWRDHYTGFYGGMLSYAGFSICFDGGITNRSALNGSLPENISDIEFIHNMINTSKSPHNHKRLAEALRKINGAASVIVLFDNMLAAGRDAWGMKPLVMGRTAEGATVFASEVAALYNVGAEFVRDVNPGEVVYVALEKGAQPQSISINRPAQEQFCAFEDVYRSLTNSVHDGAHVGTMRYKFGFEAAGDFPHKADIIVPVPSSGIVPAEGASARLGVPMKRAIMRSGYGRGRSFGQTTAELRKMIIRLKFTLDYTLLKGKRVLVVDDSIVRGDVTRELAAKVFAAGASEVHWMSSSPAVRYPCFYGTGEPSIDRLISVKFPNPEELARELNLSSVTFLKTEGLIKVLDEFGLAKKKCMACFSGRYNIPR